MQKAIVAAATNECMQQCFRPTRQRLISRKEPFEVQNMPRSNSIELADLVPVPSNIEPLPYAEVLRVGGLYWSIAPDLIARSCSRRHVARFDKIADETDAGVSEGDERAAHVNAPHDRLRAKAIATIRQHTFRTEIVRAVVSNDRAGVVDIIVSSTAAVDGIDAVPNVPAMIIGAAHSQRPDAARINLTQTYPHLSQHDGFRCTICNLGDAIARVD